MAESHRLFFAIYPDATALRELERAAAALREAKSVRGRWTAAEKYHMTARFIGDHGRDADDVIERASRAAAAVRCAPFDVTLDRIGTFRGRYQCPCVARCAAPAEAGLQKLWHSLGEALAAVDVVSRIENHFIPHLTIAYVDRMLPEPIAIAAIRWCATEFALVDSSRSAHTIVGRWPLQS